MRPISAFLLLSIHLPSCILPSGPGGFHVKPTVFYRGEPAALEWKQIIRGYQGSGVAARYSGEAVFYRLEGEKEFRRAEVSRSEGTAKLAAEALVIRATIPPPECNDGSTLEYFLSIKFDGREVESPMRRFSAAAPQRVPIRRRE